jgi:hypothetical protein
MTDSRRILICSCDSTMPLDTESIRCGCHSEPITATQLCRAELDHFRSIAAQDGPVTVACTQEAALFSDIAAQAAGRRMAALLAAAAEPAENLITGLPIRYVEAVK